MLNERNSDFTHLSSKYIKWNNSEVNELKNIVNININNWIINE